MQKAESWNHGMIDWWKMLVAVSWILDAEQPTAAKVDGRWKIFSLTSVYRTRGYF
jgi:hypothetical protein